MVKIAEIEWKLFYRTFIEFQTLRKCLFSGNLFHESKIQRKRPFSIINCNFLVPHFSFDFISFCALEYWMFHQLLPYSQRFKQIEEKLMCKMLTEKEIWWHQTFQKADFKTDICQKAVTDKLCYFTNSAAFNLRFSRGIFSFDVTLLKIYSWHFPFLMLYLSVW